ncbi:MAG: ABC transporter substrate-binding protein [Clostridiales bacterium]|nr:ABC transporter substrate-binding protein [Clostridiales bacterium]
MKKRNLVVVLLLAILLLSVGCSNKVEKTDIGVESTEESMYPMTITDSYNREVTIESEPMRVVSMAPSISETLYYVDAIDKLVGRTEYCDFPEEIQGIDTVGSLMEPNIEKIVELNPDLVIASTHFPEDAVKTMEGLGIKVVVFVPEKVFSGAYDTITVVGKVLNKEAEATRQIEKMKKTVDEIVSRVKELEKKSVYYTIGFGEYGDYTAGGDSFINEMIEMAGGENIAVDVSGWSYSLEKIIENNPDVIIISKYYGMKETFEKTEGYKDLDAVKNGNLIAIDINKIDRQGPRLAEGLLDLAKAIHGDNY